MEERGEYTTGGAEVTEKASPKAKMGEAKAVTPDVLYRERLGKLLDLTEDQKKRIKKFIKKNLEAWENDTADLHDNLVADNDLVENVVEDTGYPYEGAPNYHLPVTNIYSKIYKSVEKRSILGAGNIWHPQIEPDAYGTPIEQMAPAVADMMNFKAQHEWNISESLEDVLHPTNRDGLGVIKVPYVEELKKQRDILIFESIDEFTGRFRTAESAGMDEETYTKTLETLREATEENPVEIPVEFEKVIYSGPKGKVVELINFVTFPANCQSLSAEYCKGYGELFTLRKGAVRAKGRSGAWYADAVKRVCKSRTSSERNAMRASQDEIEGLSHSDTDDIKFGEFVIRFAMDRRGDEEEYLVTYCPDEEEVMAIIDYPYRVDFYALFRIEKRTNRLIGNSVPNQSRDLNELMDKQISQRVLSREIATIPTFKGKKTAKADFDAEAEENRWRVGRIFWLDDPESFEQFKVQPTDLGESMQEEKNAMSMLDLLLGSSASLLSGQAATSDPGAPGNKTAMMINQSNLRMDDPISTLRDGVSQLGNICLSHMYQFGPPIISYVADGQNGTAVKSLKKKFLRSGIKMAMAGMNVVDNPESEMSKWFALGAQLMQLEPMFAQNPDARMEVWKMAMNAGRVPNRNKLLPSPEQVQQKQIAMMAEAQKQVQVQQAVAGVVQAKEKEKQRFADLREGLARRALVKKAAAVAAGEEGNAPEDQ